MVLFIDMIKSGMELPPYVPADQCVVQIWMFKYKAIMV